MCLAPSCACPDTVAEKGMGLRGCSWGLGRVAGQHGLQVPIKGVPSAPLVSPPNSRALAPQAHLASPRVVLPALSCLLAPAVGLWRAEVGLTLPVPAGDGFLTLWNCFLPEEPGLLVTKLVVLFQFLEYCWQQGRWLLSDFTDDRRKGPEK